MQASPDEQLPPTHPNQAWIDMGMTFIVNAKLKCPMPYNH